MSFNRKECVIASLKPINQLPIKIHLARCETLRTVVITYFKIDYFAVLSTALGPLTKIFLPQHTSSKPPWPEIPLCLKFPGLFLFRNIVQRSGPEADVTGNKLYTGKREDNGISGLEIRILSFEKT